MDDRLTLSCGAALDATRREVALADAEPDPDALQMREVAVPGVRRDDAKAEQRLRKIKELMKTDHVRRFAPLLTGRPGGAGDGQALPARLLRSFAFGRLLRC